MDKKKQKEEDNQSKKFELLALHIEMFKNAFAEYIEYYESFNEKTSEKNGTGDRFNYDYKNYDYNSTKDAESNKFAEVTAKDSITDIADADICGNDDKNNGEINNMLFEEIICNYYETVISGLKKLVKYDKKYLKILVETYEELWKSAPRLKEKDYLSPYLSDLCRFLYEIKETGMLTFFYNLLIYCREIPFLSLHEKQEKYIINLYAQNEEKDPFVEFREERKERITNNFDEVLFNKIYDKFFLILSGWNKKAEGYYTKDEIFFMNGLFILDELIGYAYFEEKNGEEPITDFYKDKDNGIFQEVINPNGHKNIYRYVLGDATNEKISCFYEKALRFFSKAINYNPNNPRYYYEYARCLKNSGKSEEAEIFFKKAFDLNG